jgi:hypothetical protein
MFKNFFRKKNPADNDTPSAATRLSPQLKVMVETSPLLMMPQRLFMHYLSDNLKKEPGNPDWENQAVFFWDYDEPFEKKSLPAEFKTYREHYFVYSKALPEGMSFLWGKVIPWFGMPGGGKKYHVEFNGAHVPVKELIQRGSFEEVEIVTLTQENSDILQKRGEYFFFIDEKKLQFDKSNGKFFVKGKEIRFSDAFEMDLLKIVRPLSRQN